MYVDLEWDYKLASALGEKSIERAGRRALRTAVRAMKTQVTREVRAKKNVKAKAVNKSMVATSAQKGMTWRLTVFGRPTPMSAYPARQTRKGVTVRVNKSTGSLVRGAFLATVGRGGHVGVFVRVGGRRGKPPMRAELPIRELFSSTITDVLRDAGVVARIQARASEVFRREFSRLIDLERSKK